MNTTQNCLDLFWHLKNGKIATLDRYFFDAFLPKICAKWSVSTISIPSAEALELDEALLARYRHRLHILKTQRPELSFF